MFRRLLLAAVVLVALLFGFEWLTFPDVAALATEPPASTAFMELRKSELRAAGKDDTLLYHWVPYEQISPYLRRGALVAEDDSFYQHDAVDVKGLEEALQKDWEKRRVTHGGSTITQQLAKNLYLSPSRNPLRKIREYFIATSLEKHLTKKRILEIYLNVVEMGERVYGAEAASRLYFHTSASGISASQAALLAGCLPNPRIMNPGAPNKRLRWRQRMILSRMRRWGYLLERDVLTAKKPASAAPESTATIPEPVPDSALSQTPANDTATPAPVGESTTAAPATETISKPPPAPVEPAPSEPPATETSATTTTG